jgi:hypothetical protein
MYRQRGNRIKKKQNCLIWGIMRYSVYVYENSVGKKRNETKRRDMNSISQRTQEHNSLVTLFSLLSSLS